MLVSNKEGFLKMVGEVEREDFQTQLCEMI